LGERLLCKQEVDGSIPFTSTKIGDKPSAGALGALGIGRSNAFVGACKRADSFFDMVKSGVSEKLQAGVVLPADGFSGEEYLHARLVCCGA
jgi:hypothetical protein